MDNQEFKGIRISGKRISALTNMGYFIYDLLNMLSPSLLKHSLDVAQDCEDLAKRLGWGASEVHKAYVCGLMHDIGYLVSPRKPGPWFQDSKDDIDMETSHPELGKKLLSRVESLVPIIPAVLHHHEHLDGSGFPGGLRGEAIPVEARLVAVANSYRIYRNGGGSTRPMSDAEARKVLQEDAGIILDPVMVKGLLEMLPTLEPDFEPDF